MFVQQVQSRNLVKNTTPLRTSYPAMLFKGFASQIAQKANKNTLCQSAMR